MRSFAYVVLVGNGKIGSRVWPAAEQGQSRRGVRQRPAAHRQGMQSLIRRTAIRRIVGHVWGLSRGAVCWTGYRSKRRCRKDLAAEEKWDEVRKMKKPVTPSMLFYSVCFLAFSAVWQPASDVGCNKSFPSRGVGRPGTLLLATKKK